MDLPCHLRYTNFAFNCLCEREATSHLRDLLKQRLHMDWRRLEEAFLLQTCLQTIQKHDMWENLSSIPYDNNEMVEEVTKKFATAFQKKWGGIVNLM